MSAAVTRSLVGVATWVAVAGLVGFATQRASGTMSPQSRANVAVLSNRSLVAALRVYPRAWPPAYPAALWTSRRLGLRARYFNPLCFFGILLLAYAFTSRHVGSIHPILPVLTLASTHAAYVNIYQLTGETLFCLLAFTSLLGTIRYRERPTPVKALWLGLVSGATCLTRFMGLFWTVPRTLVELWRRRTVQSPRDRWLGLLAFVAGLSVLFAPWVVLLRYSTGYYLGMNRFGLRSVRPHIRYWNSVVDFSHNVRFAFRTLAIDLFSPARHADHDVVHGIAPPLVPGEPLSFILAAVLLLAAAAAFYLSHRKARPRTPASTSDSVVPSARWLPLQYTLVYWVAVILVWSAGNNDPIYSRFLYPSYPFAILSMFSAYATVKEGGSLQLRAPFVLLFSLFVVVNVTKLLVNTDFSYQTM